MVYLLGPGDHRAGREFEAGELGNQHTEPRVVASWDPTRTASWARHCTGVDWGDPDTAWAGLRTLAQAIGDEAAAGVRLEDTTQPRNAVWHTVMAAHPDDGQLTDGQWQAIAARLMHQTKLHETGSDNPVRWVAVRHGPNAAGADHIHVMAVLVRLDGTRASVHNDVFAAQAAARWAENEYHLTPGRGRTAPDEPGQAARADRASARSDMAATNRAGAPYPRPADMTQPTWERVQQEGQDRMWTRQGRARAAVLSAAARAISGEHLVALVEEQGYQVRLRYSPTSPGQVTGWSLVAPPTPGARRPKAFAGRALGADCTWPALIAHIDARAMSAGFGIIGQKEEDQAMIDRAQMITAGWGTEFIDRVIAADQTLASAGLDADPAVAYWLRDVFWQVAWALEQSHGQHGPWTDAAYLYSAIATGGPPAPPVEVHTALADLRDRIDLAHQYQAQVAADRAARDAYADALIARSDQVDRWAASLDTPPHIPYYLTSPGGARYMGAAAVAVALTTMDIKRHTKALQVATATHRAAAVQMRHLDALDQEAGRYLEQDLHPWLRAAQQHEANLLAALDDHAHAQAQWRQAAGQLLADVRHDAQAQTSTPVPGTPGRARRRGPLPITS